jgi:cytochrome c2
MSRDRTLAALLVGAGACVMVVGPAAAGPGEGTAGAAVFAAKQCDRCHRPQAEGSTGPALEILRRRQGAMEFAGRLWNHVPGMFTTLAQQGLRWPAIDVGEMTALMAYLQADARRDPVPDPARGSVVLMRKGCLKCHSLRGEGGRVQPDLAHRRPEYESAVVWASAMWAHTPVMAEMAIDARVPYPRFAGNEMGNLVGFLKGTARPEPAGGSTKAPRR